jgi:hypothetical protein
MLRDDFRDDYRQQFAFQLLARFLSTFLTRHFELFYLGFRFRNHSGHAGAARRA